MDFRIQKRCSCMFSPHRCRFLYTCSSSLYTLSTSSLSQVCHEYSLRQSIIKPWGSPHDTVHCANGIVIRPAMGLPAAITVAICQHCFSTAVIKVHNEQQEIITALFFRHLLEHLLADETSAKDTNAMPRWRKSWESAARREHDHSDPTFPLHGLIPSGAIISDRKWSEGEKGQAFRTGKDFYGTPSVNIHKCKGGGENGYVIRSDQWGEPVGRILKALISKEFDDDGEVDWEEERKRY